MATDEERVVDAWCVVERYNDELDTPERVIPKTVFVNRDQARELAERWSRGSDDAEYSVVGVRLVIKGQPERTCHDYGGEEETNGELYDFACDKCGFACDTPQPNYCPGCGAMVISERGNGHERDS